MVISKFELIIWTRNLGYNLLFYDFRLGDICDLIEHFLDKPPISWDKVKKQNVFKKIKYIREYVNDLKMAKGLGDNYEGIYRLFTESGAGLLDEWFESDVLKATLATDSVIGAMLSPYSSGSAYVLLHHIIGGVDGIKGNYYIYQLC